MSTRPRIERTPTSLLAAEIRSDGVASERGVSSFSVSICLWTRLQPGVKSKAESATTTAKCVAENRCRRVRLYIKANKCRRKGRPGTSSLLSEVTLTKQVRGCQRAQPKEDPLWIEPQFGSLTTRGMFAAAPDLHDPRFFGFLTILTTILAAFLGPTIARRVRTLIRLFFSHEP